MKHNLRITFILLAMFLVTQFIGLYVVGHYTEEGNSLPYGLEPPTPETNTEYSGFFMTIIIAFVFAILLFFVLTKLKIEFILRLWFFVVVTVALAISFLSFTSDYFTYALIISSIAALTLAFIKIYRRNFFIHNATELLIYPGIAAVFVPILNVYTIIALLILISIYDMWAVWHSGIMQKMAKYQIDNLGVFSGFFVPYVSKKTRSQIKMWKKTLSKSELQKKKIKANIAILGGGDVVFPIITAGVMLKTFGLGSALFVIFGATLGLAYLFSSSEKKKFYPAMPFITAGIFLGMLLCRLIL
ncbi:MAG: presenilin family intramembrane aspartyl protease [Nanoarchaeota archaeon]|nr:presenilin family intramembrane aspartyl protease [Nanoarchaeota archaeon]